MPKKFEKRSCAWTAGALASAASTAVPLNANLALFMRMLVSIHRRCRNVHRLMSGGKYRHRRTRPRHGRCCFAARDRSCGNVHRVLRQNDNPGTDADTAEEIADVFVGQP